MVSICFFFYCGATINPFGLKFLYGLFLALTNANKDKADIAMDDQVSAEHGKSSYAGMAPNPADHSLAIGMDSFADCLNAQHGSVSRKRRKGSATTSVKEQAVYTNNSQSQLDAQLSQWKRIMLLVVAITVHNIPEGLAVGVSFGAIGTTESATFEAARYEEIQSLLACNIVCN